MLHEQLRLFDPGPPRLVGVDGFGQGHCRDPVHSVMVPGTTVGKVTLLEPVERGWQYQGGGDDAA